MRLGWPQNFCSVGGFFGESTVIFLFHLLLSELFMADPATWHKVRGAQILLSMKIISLGYDVGKGTVADLPNIFEYMGYCFNVGTVIFGPWITYEQYYKLLDAEANPMSMVWAAQVLSTTGLSVFCLVYSNCFTHWLILDSVNKWFLAYRDAQSFRFSHYFISFLSDATSSLSGISPDGGSQLQWSVAKPQHIEVPRSLVEVVTNWNLPMHSWLKTYVFKPVRPYGTFLAVIMTYAASSLLHVSSQLRHTFFRRRLSQIFDACVQAKRCKEKCDHKFTSRHPAVFLTNLAFGALAVFHLAYLGLMFDSSDGEDKGYTMWHTLDKWSSLSFLSHWVALGTLVFYWLI
ncbi:protein-serine O-palmitoleoyltransferase porcupine-like [Aplysia californica]|uniref:Protein-serine O-palmitoleoyltransferase porcupine n=1 Tax=Aplysia californica TaxID=6500 RepID=A0ABM1W3B6_APLCA|nr:protein-serine O-palmitoleoyltransferase porcupine-like [Aplysia californica]